MTDRMKLSRDVQDYIAFVTGLTNTWSFYLRHPDFDDEHYLRANLFSIWILGLAEAAAESHNTLNGLRRRADKLGHAAALHYLDIISKLHDGIADLLAQLTRDEMLMLGSFRDQAVHGLIQAGKRRLLLSDGRQVRRTYVSAAEASAVVYAMWEPGWEPSMTEVRRKILGYPTMLWLLLDNLCDSVVQDRFRTDLEQDPFNDPGIVMIFVDDDYWATQAVLAERGELRRRWDGRSDAPADAGKMIDPVIALLD